MSANVETMMYTREKPWHGLGTKVMEAPTSADAIRLAGLNWTVEPKPVYDGEGTPIPGWVANTRSSDGKVLGLVTTRYKVVQNADAFSFTDHLIGGDVRYETAGSLREGKQVWLLAKMPSAKVAGDEVEPYFCFTNTHDGTGAVRVCMTPVRVVCNNTLNLALSSAMRSWSMIHTGDIEGKISEARQTLELAQRYMLELDRQAEEYANTPIRQEWLDQMLSEWFPVSEEDSDRKKAGVKKMKDQFMIAYYMPDIAKFRGTAWGVINAASDMLHNAPLRQTKNYQANQFGRIIAGHPLVDMVTASCNKL